MFLNRYNVSAHEEGQAPTNIQCTLVNSIFCVCCRQQAEFAYYIILIVVATALCLTVQQPLYTPTPRPLVAVARWGNTESTAAFCAALGEWNKTRRLVAKDGEEVDGRDGVKPKSEGTEESTVRADREEDHHPPSSAIEQQQAAEGCCPGAQQRAEHHQRLEEGAPSNPTAPTKESFDFILAGDVLYKESLLAPFLGTVREMLAAGGKMFLCHVPRAGVTYEIVEQALADAGFGFQVVSGNTKSTSSGWERGEGGENEAGENSNSISATAVGGIDLCVDDARRARLYEVQSIDPRFC